MPFPWRRYWRRVGVIFIAAMLISIVVTAVIHDGRIALDSLFIAVVDSVVLAVVVAFPLTQPIYRGPRR